MGMTTRFEKKCLSMLVLRGGWKAGGGWPLEGRRVMRKKKKIVEAECRVAVNNVEAGNQI